MFALIAASSADQSHHQVVKHGNAPSVSVSLRKAQRAAHASVASQPHAAPQSVDAYHNIEKPVADVHSPAAVPSYTAAPVYDAAAPVYDAAAAPAYSSPAIAYNEPAPAYDAPAPAYDAPAPAYNAPVVVSKPAYHVPAASAYKEPAYNEPAVYAYNYAVADDYSGSKFNAGENRDGYATSGSYSVALPDGRIQTVTYKVADAYSGYVAEVTYSGEPIYPAAPAYKPAVKPIYKQAAVPVYEPAPVPAYTPAPVPAYGPAPVPAYEPAPVPAYEPVPVPAYAESESA